MGAFFLTYNAQPSGIFEGQVIDVVKLLREESGASVRLVSFIPIRGFFRLRQGIREKEPRAIVLPMVPKSRNWRWNFPLLFLLGKFLRPDLIIGRGAFAAGLALMYKGRDKKVKVCYDGRTAVAAEVTEYQVIPDRNVKAEVEEVECNAVLKSDFRMAVSQPLVDYWGERYGYQGDAHVVIPCTLSSDFQIPTLERIRADRKEVRGKLGVKEEEVLVAYSGSLAGWQSIELMEALFRRLLELRSDLQLLLLTKDSEALGRLRDEFPGRIHIEWLPHHEVSKHLRAADHGVIFRESSVTNRMGAPTKFAEYLASGLYLIVSDNMAISPWVEHWGCGKLVNPESFEGLEGIERVGEEEKGLPLSLARDHYLKSSSEILRKYHKLIPYIKPSQERG